MSFPIHLDKRITKARFNLYDEYPFFAQIAQYFKPIINNNIPTMGITANSELYCNQEFLEKCNEADLTWLIAHEAFHIVTMTHARFPEGAYPVLWNIASDAIINIIITDDAKIPLPRAETIVPIYGGQFAKYKDSTTEAAYFDLLQNGEKTLGMSAQKFVQQFSNGPGKGASPGTGGGGKGKMQQYWWDDSASQLGEKGNTKGIDENGNSQSDGGMTEEQRSQWKERIAAAHAAAKMAGKLPGGVDKFCTTLLAPKKDWKRELRSLAYTAIRTQWTFKYPGRRTAGLNIRTPGKDRGTPTAICYIDTSGSMSDVELQRCLSETSKIFKICGGKGHLILGDAEIYFSGEMKADELGRLKEIQRGGTDFTVLFDHIAETFDKTPALLVGFTDLCGPFPKNPPNFPVIWCRPNSGYKGVAPWGRLIEVDIV